MKDAGSSAVLSVYPARVDGDRVERPTAERLSRLIRDAEVLRATPQASGPLFQGRGWPNEMHVLWRFAHAARDYARAHPVDDGVAAGLEPGRPLDDPSDAGFGPAWHIGCPLTRTDLALETPRNGRRTHLAADARWKHAGSLRWSPAYGVSQSSGQLQ